MRAQRHEKLAKLDHLLIGAHDCLLSVHHEHNVAPSLFRGSDRELGALVALQKTDISAAIENTSMRRSSDEKSAT